MLLLSSCMMMDHDMILDEEGRVSLSVRGYVYSGVGDNQSWDDAEASVPAAAQPMEVCVYDRDDISFSDPLASSFGVTSMTGYYEIDLVFASSDDIIIRVSPADASADTASEFVSGFYSWSGSLYDDESGVYVANMPPLYLE